LSLVSLGDSCHIKFGQNFSGSKGVRNTTDRTCNTVTIIRTEAQMQQIVEPGGRALTFQYASGGISQIMDPLGRSVTYSYEAPLSPYFCHV
jgi:uncharacterized protein RhaS with RHS repeats